MRYIYTILFFFSILLSATGQKAQPVGDVYPQALPMAEEKFLPGDFDEYNTAQFLLNRYYSGQNFNLVLLEEKNSLTGKHQYYQLKLNGAPVYLAQVQVHLNNAGSAEVSYPLVNVPKAKAVTSQIDINQLMAKHNALDYSAPQDEHYLHEGQLLPVKKIRLHGQSSMLRELIVYGDSVLVNADLRKFNKDSTVSGYVFYPDPLSSANVNYGGNYRDFADANNSSLSAERVLVNFKARYNLGVFTLDNSVLKIVDHDAPNIAPATSILPSFFFERNQSGFEDVNAFYHITEYKKFLDSIGHTALPGFKVEADVHAISGADQSWYSPNIKKLAFGDGGVDDAEDADVIIHEYGHAVVDGAVVGITSVPKERAMLEEALCDYFAVSYTAALSPHQTNRVFNWDGHNEFWPGRMATSLKNYQLENFNGSIYDHTDIMVSCLREIETNLGPKIANQVILEALYRLQTNSTYVDFANSVVNVDGLLNGGANFQVIATAFQRRNILAADFAIAGKNIPDNKIGLYSSIDFAAGGNALLVANEKIEAFTLFNSSGAMVNQRANIGTREVTISSTSLAAGLYILQTETISGRKASFKLIRY